MRVANYRPERYWLCKAIGIEMGKEGSGKEGRKEKTTEMCKTG
jgi:hypothetical protein